MTDRMHKRMEKQFPNSSRASARLMREASNALANPCKEAHVHNILITASSLCRIHGASESSDGGLSKRSAYIQLRAQTNSELLFNYI
jgi:hypothetical protein